jgi:hypothetical protein
MPWVTFTADTIRDGLAVREVNIYLKTAEVDDDGNLPTDSGVLRMERIAVRVVNQFRGEILANPLVIQLGPEGTIPAFCEAWALAIARVAMMGLSPVEEGRTDPRRDEYTDAVKGRDSLKSMPAAAFAFEDPSGASGGYASYGGKPLLEF